MSALPDAVQRYLRREQIAPLAAAALSFDGDWRLLGRSGELTRFALDQAADADLERQFRELCMGQSRLGGTRLSQLDLGEGHNADVHLVAEHSQVHVVLVDVHEAVEQERSWQQNAQEAKLRSYEQGRQLRDLRQQRISIEAERDAAKAQASELSARNQLFDQRLRGVLAEIERSAERLLALPAEHGGRQRETELLRQAISQADRCRLSLARAVARISGQVDDTISQVALDQLSAELYASVAVLLEAPERSLSLRLQQRSPEPLRMVAGAAAEIFHYALWASLLRCRGELEAVLRWDGQFAQLQCNSDSDDLSLTESALLWDQQLPAVDDPPLTYALFGLGRSAHRHHGRVLEQRDSDGRHRLLISLPGRREEPSGDITSPGFRGPVGLICGDAEYAEEWVAQLATRGIPLSLHSADPESLQALYENPPPALLFDLQSAAGAPAMAYKLRARGYPGMLLALGELGHPMTNSMAATWSAMLPRDCSLRQLLRTLSGRSGA